MILWHDADQVHRPVLRARIGVGAVWHPGRGIGPIGKCWQHETTWWWIWTYHMIQAHTYHTEVHPMIVYKIWYVYVCICIWRYYMYHRSDHIAISWIVSPYPHWLNDQGLQSWWSTHWTQGPSSCCPLVDDFPWLAMSWGHLSIDFYDFYEYLYDYVYKYIYIYV